MTFVEDKSIGRLVIGGFGLPYLTENNANVQKIMNERLIFIIRLNHISAGGQNINRDFAFFRVDNPVPPHSCMFVDFEIGLSILKSRRRRKDFDDMVGHAHYS